MPLPGSPEEEVPLPPNAICPACGRRVILRRDGTFRVHNTGMQERKLPWQVRCKVSGTLPVQAS